VDAAHDPERGAVTAALLGLVAAGVVFAAGWRLRPLGGAQELPSHATEARRPPRPRDGRGADERIVTVGTAAVGFAGGLVLLGPAAALVVAVSVPTTRHVARLHGDRRRAAARVASLPATIDLLVVALSSGATLRQGLQLVSERGPPLVRPIFADVVGRMNAGEALAVALPRLIDDLGEPVRGLVRAIVVADRDGVPLRSLLGRIADDARRQRRHALEAAIRRLPVRLAFPLVACVLPAFVVLTVVPVVGAGLHRLGPVGP
jgi:Flp pilus assembly protein TadB